MSGWERCGESGDSERILSYVRGREVVVSEDGAKLRLWAGVGDLDCDIQAFGLLDERKETNDE